MYELCMLGPPFDANNLDELFDKVRKREIKSFDNFYS